MDESEYKVSRLLGPLMELAATGQKGANISVDCRLYFRLDPNDNRLKGEVAFLDRRTGKLVKQRSTVEDSLPLDSEEGMLWFLDKIGRHGFDLVRARASKTHASKSGNSAGARVGGSHHEPESDHVWEEAVELFLRRDSNVNAMMESRRIATGWLLRWGGAWIALLDDRAPDVVILSEDLQMPAFRNLLQTLTAQVAARGLSVRFDADAIADVAPA